MHALEAQRMLLARIHTDFMSISHPASGATRILETGLSRRAVLILRTGPHVVWLQINGTDYLLRIGNQLSGGAYPDMDAGTTSDAPRVQTDLIVSAFTWLQANGGAPEGSPRLMPAESFVAGRESAQVTVPGRKS
jgi:hypothetical protein